MIFIPKTVKFAMDTLVRNGFEAYLVGGCVRDSLLGGTPTDYDVTTSALPQEIMQCFLGEKLLETGIKHGTVTLIKDGTPLEITTYRIDAEYRDNRHPERVYFTRSLREDLSRRDFTVNAMAYSEKAGLVDAFGGQADLKAETIRCVGDADTRFREDALRILRAVRFASVLDFKIEAATEQAIFNNAELLSGISRERIFAELKKLICGKAAPRVIERYLPVLQVFLPELTLPRVDLCALLDGLPAVLHLRLAALLFDLQDTVAPLTRLRVDRATIKKVAALRELSDLPLPQSKAEIKRLLNKYSPPLFLDFLTLKSAADPTSAEKCRELTALTEALLKNNECYSPSELAIGGDELIALGVKPGKDIGKYLNLLLEAVITELVPNKPDALLEYIKRLI